MRKGERKEKKRKENISGINNCCTKDISCVYIPILVEI